MLFTENELNECQNFKGFEHFESQSFYWSARWYAFLDNETRFLKNY